MEDRDELLGHYRQTRQDFLSALDGLDDRQMQRNLQLGAMRDAVATRLSGDYLAFSAELGRRFDVAGIALTPYAGSQFVRIANDGFAESGATGFGLRAEAWDSQRWQGFAGLRAQRGWRIGDAVVSADARAEWQRTEAEGYLPHRLSIADEDEVELDALDVAADGEEGCPVAGGDGGWVTVVRENSAGTEVDPGLRKNLPYMVKLIPSLVKSGKNGKL